MLLRNILFVAFGGAVGSVLRYITGIIISTKKIPLATLTVNIIGSFLIGILMGYLVKQLNQQGWQLLLVTGFCGGFTTFSAFSWDIVQMFQQQRYSTAFIYILSTLFLGILSTALGFWLIRQAI
jgi:CrcB protein